VHRYTEIQEFPQALNNSQKWNWHTRMFLAEATANLTAEETSGSPLKYTREELQGLEMTLIEHEIWLDKWVEKQKGVPLYEDPVVQTKEMRERAKTLEMHLQKLALKKPPKVKKTSSSTSTTSTSTSTSTAGGARSSSGSEAGDSTQRHDEL